MRNWQWFTGLSLLQGPLHWAIELGSLVALAALLALRRTRMWWTRWVPVAGVLAVLLLTAVWLWLQVTKPWPDALPPVVLAWVGAGLLAVVLLAIGWRHQRWRVRGVALGAALLVVAGAADGVNTAYGSFPTVASALQLPPPNSVPVESVLKRAHRTTAAVPGRPLSAGWRSPTDLPRHGSVTEVAIPAARSGFSARPAWLYVPPAYFARTRPLLPVLLLIGGQPGTPRNWLDGGGLAEMVDAWANAHGGLAPVVVMPDALGGTFANPLCMDSRLGRSDTYLARDVVAWVRSALQVDPRQAHWAVGGISFGGTCALQLAVAHPDVFPTFIDFSGQSGPTLGTHARTVAAAFGGDEAAFDAVDPLHELATRRYPRSAGYLTVGAGDHFYRPQALEVARATRAAGMSIMYTVQPGGHAWSVWRSAFPHALSWLGSRTGISP